MDDAELWKTLLALAGGVISVLMATVVYLVTWIRSLYAEARTAQAAEVRERDVRHDRLLDVVSRMQESLPRAVAGRGGAA